MIIGSFYVLVTKNKNDKPEVYDAIIYYSTGDIDYKGKLSINTIDSPKFDYFNVDSFALAGMEIHYICTMEDF